MQVGGGLDWLLHACRGHGCAPALGSSQALWPPRAAQTRHHRLPRMRPRPRRRLGAPPSTIGPQSVGHYNPPLFTPSGGPPVGCVPNKCPATSPHKSLSATVAGGPRRPQPHQGRPATAGPRREVLTLGQEGPAKRKGGLCGLWLAPPLGGGGRWHFASFPLGNLSSSDAGHCAAVGGGRAEQRQPRRPAIKNMRPSCRPCNSVGPAKDVAGWWRIEDNPDRREKKSVLPCDEVTRQPLRHVGRLGYHAPHVV